VKRDSFWFPFEPNRWLSNEKLGMVSLEARGLWIHLLCLMYKANAGGKLLIGGNIPTTEQLNRSVGDDCGVALKELQVARVYELKDGAIYHEGVAHQLQKMNDRLDGYRRRDESKMVNRSTIDEPSIDDGWGYNNNNNKSNSKSNSESKRNNQNKDKEFVAPTKDEWLNYSKEKYPEMPTLEAEGAWFHYESKGWIIGRIKAKDWKKCLGTCYVFWKKNKYNKQTMPEPSQLNFKGQTKLKI
jgi:hypothetical protein